MKKLLVFFIALGLLSSCEEEETSYALQEVSAPSNVKAIFDISQDDSGTVTVTPTAVGATTFNIYFGDTENEKAAEYAVGQTITHVYAEGEYTLRVVAVGLTGLTSELSRVVTISFSAPSELSAEIDASASNPFEVTVTPSATNATVFDIYFGDTENEEATTIMVGESGTHVYAEVGDYTVRVVARGAGAATTEITEVVTISGAAEPMALPINFDNATVNYAFETFNGATYEVVENPDVAAANATASKVGAITNSGANWEGGSFALGTPVDFSGSEKTINIKFWSNVALPVLLKFEGGVNGERQNEVTVSHGGTGWEDLSFDFATSATKSYIDGNQGVGEAFVPTGQYATMVMFVDGPGTTAGTFYIDDIMLGSGTVVMADPTSAPAQPSIAEANVISIFSDVYTDPAGVNYRPDWGQSTVYEEVDLNGDKVIKYSDINYEGIDFGGAIDVSSLESFHIDVWSADYTAIPFFMISAGSGEKSVTLNVVPNQWNSIDIPLSDFTDQGLVMNDIIQFKIDVQPDNGGTVYFDNLYFYTDAGTPATEPTAAAPVPTLDAANVISIFSDVYTDPAGVNYRPDWGQSTVYEEVDLNGDKAIKYSDVNYEGIDFGGAIDVSAFQSLHIDVWSADYAAIPFFMISAGSGEKSVTLNVVPNQWNSIDIPLSDFTDQGLGINDIIQFKIDVQPDNGGTVYFDNIYFQN